MTTTATQPQPRQANGAAPRSPNAQWSEAARDAHRAAQEPLPSTVPPTAPNANVPPASAGADTFTRIARAAAVLHLVTPAGIAVDLSVNAATPAQELGELMKVATLAAEIATRAGWTAASTAAPEAGGPQQPAQQFPTFWGYPCSYTFDERGYPNWIKVDGRTAYKHDKQQDTWFSIKTAEKTDTTPAQFEHVLRIGKGEKSPAIVWPAGQQPK